MAAARYGFIGWDTVSSDLAASHREAQIVTLTGWTFDEIDRAHPGRVDRMLMAAQALRKSRDEALDLYAGLVREGVLDDGT